MGRRELDAYYTPTWAVDVLRQDLGRQLKGMSVFEPCVGDGAISRGLVAAAERVLTNDIDPNIVADYHFDATKTWPIGGHEQLRRGDCAWVVTNPPFKYAKPIFDQARASAIYGIAFLLRLSWLEPTFDRNLHPNEAPDRIIVLPRISFTGDGKTDSVTCAWMIWSPYVRKGIKIIPKFAAATLE